MTREEAAVELRRQADRTVTTFLRTVKDPAVESAFWDAVYGEGATVGHADAVRVADEMERSRKRVGEIINRPSR